MTNGLAAFAWLVIGISEEIRLKNLTVDVDKLVVSDVSRKVGIGVTDPQSLLHIGNVRNFPGTYSRLGGDVTVQTDTPHGLIIGSGIRVRAEDFEGTFLVTDVPTPTTFTFEYLPPGVGSGDIHVFALVYQTGYIQDVQTNTYDDRLSQNGVILLSGTSSSPTVDGTTFYQGTLWLNSDAEFIQNSGSSLAMGGVTFNRQESVFVRCSGVQTLLSQDFAGDFAVDTIFTRGVVEGIYERYATDIVIFAPQHGFQENEFVTVDFKTGQATAEDGVYRIVGRTNNSFRIVSKPGNEGFAKGLADVIVFDTNMFDRFRITSEGNVGMGVTTPEVKLDVRGDLRTDGLVTLSYSQSENIVEQESNADPQTHILGEAALNSLNPDGSKFDDQGLLTRFGASSQNNPPTRVCEFTGMDRTVNPFIRRTEVYISATCDDEIRFFDTFSNFSALNPTPGANQGVPSPTDNVFFNISINRGGNLVKLEDGVPVWATRQDSETGWDTSSSVTVLNRNTSNPYIVVSGLTTLPSNGPIFFRFTNTRGVVSAPHSLSMPFLNADRRYFFNCVYNGRGDVVGSIGLFTDGLQTYKSTVVALEREETDPENTYYFYYIVNLSTTVTQEITLVYRDFDTNSMATITRPHPNPVSGYFTYIAKFSFNETGTPSRLDIEWDTVITPGRLQIDEGGVTVDPTNNLLITAAFDPGLGPVRLYGTDYFDGGAPVKEFATALDRVSSITAKISKTGSPMWVTGQVSSGNVVPFSLTTDRFGGVYIGGMYTPSPLGSDNTILDYTPASVSLSVFDTTDESQPSYTLTRTIRGGAAYICKLTPEGVFDWLTIVDNEGEPSPNGGRGDRLVPRTIAVDILDNLIVAVDSPTQNINIYNWGNPEVRLFKTLTFPSKSATALIKYTGGGLCLNYSSIVNKDRPERGVKISSMTSASNGTVNAVGSTNSLLYIFNSPDGSSFASVLNRDLFVSGDALEGFYFQLPYQPTYILREPASEGSYRIRFSNLGTVQCYLTFLDSVLSNTYDFVAVPFEGSVDLEYISGSWRRANNIIRGPVNINEREFSIQLGGTESEKTFEIIGDIRVVGDFECVRDVTCRDFTVTSDIRLKQFITPPEQHHGKIEIVDFEFDDGRKKIGVIAQDIEQHFPDMVWRGETLSVNMDQLFVIGILDTQKLARKLDEVESSCDEIQQMLDQLIA